MPLFRVEGNVGKSQLNGSGGKWELFDLVVFPAKSNGASQRYLRQQVRTFAFPPEIGLARTIYASDSCIFPVRNRQRRWQHHNFMSSSRCLFYSPWSGHLGESLPPIRLEHTIRERRVSPIPLTSPTNIMPSNAARP